MKKLLSLLLCLAIIIGTLLGCTSCFGDEDVYDDLDGECFIFNSKEGQPSVVYEFYGSGEESKYYICSSYVRVPDAEQGKERLVLLSYNMGSYKISGLNITFTATDGSSGFTPFENNELFLKFDDTIIIGTKKFEKKQ